MEWMNGVDKKLNNCWKIIDRKNFVPDPNIDSWKINKPIIIGKGQTTSQPTLISDMLKHMDIHEIIKKKTDNPNYEIRVLDIGSGSGIVSALIACLIGKGNYVLGIDLYKKLVEDSKNNIKKIKKQNFKNFKNFAKIEFKQKNAYELFNRKNKENKENEKYDLIYVGAEPKEEEDIVKFKKGVPEKDGIALGPIEGQIQKFKKKNNGNGWEKINIPVRFVPLKNKKGGERKKYHYWSPVETDTLLEQMDRGLGAVEIKQLDQKKDNPIFSTRTVESIQSKVLRLRRRHGHSASINKKERKKQNI